MVADSIMWNENEWFLQPLHPIWRLFLIQSLFHRVRWRALVWDTGQLRRNRLIISSLILNIRPGPSQIILGPTDLVNVSSTSSYLIAVCFYVLKYRNCVLLYCRNYRTAVTTVLLYCCTAVLPYCDVLCRTVPYCAVLCRTVLYCAVLPYCCTVLYCRTVPYCAVLCRTVPYCAVLCCTVLYCCTIYDCWLLPHTALSR